MTGQIRERRRSGVVDDIARNVPQLAKAERAGRRGAGAGVADGGVVQRMGLRDEGRRQSQELSEASEYWQ